MILGAQFGETTQPTTRQQKLQLLSWFLSFKNENEMHSGEGSRRRMPFCLVLLNALMPNYRL